MFSFCLRSASGIAFFEFIELGLSEFPHAHGVLNSLGRVGVSRENVGRHIACSDFGFDVGELTLPAAHISFGFLNLFACAAQGFVAFALFGI